MKCFVAGGTGVIGRRVLALLVEAGHDVTVLCRSERSDRVAAELGGRPMRASLFEPNELITATAGHDVVINLATNIPTMRRSARSSAWSTNERIRTTGVDNLVAAALANGIDRYIQESVTFNYVDAGAEWIDENHPCTSSGDGQPVASAEARLAEYREQGGSGVVLRFGQFYDLDSDHTAWQASMARRRIDPFVGEPDGYLPLVGVPAAARAVAAALAVKPGVYNIVDDDPPTRHEVAVELAGRLGSRPLRRLPTSLVRKLIPASETLMRSQRINNGAFRDASGWRPDHAGGDGLAATLAEVGR